MSENLSDQIMEKVRFKIDPEGFFSTQIKVKTEDNIHFQVIVISEVFQPLNRVKRQQLVYAGLSEAIIGGELHAVELRTYTPDEWMNGKNNNE
jgi:acid stress-induced BolA-like protein IbaG/YrbA